MTFWWCIGVVLVSGAVLAGSWCVQRFAGRFCLRWDAERREKYLNSVLWMLFSGTEECALCPEAMSSRDRRLIAEDIADLVDSTYGLDPAPLRRIVERQRLDVFLLRRIRRNGGYRRAYYLHLLSRMPVDEKTVRAVERYTHSRNRLCTLHSVITRPEVEKFVGGMNPVQRRVLLRYIARQGYSANALQVFIPEEEKRYYVSLVDSYKLNVG